MAGQNYTWQVSSPNIGTGVGVISSAYNVDNKSPFTTITGTNPLGYVKVFPDSTSTDFNIKNLEYAIRNNGVITYRVQDGTNDPRLFNSLQELADGRGGWSGSTTQLVQTQMNGILISSAQSNGVTPSSPTPDGTPTDTAGFLTSTEIASFEKPIETKPSRTEYRELRYPKDLNTSTTKQDVIQFTMFSYGGRKVTFPTLGERDFQTKNPGSVTLSIQPRISDSNTVTWNDSSMSAIDAAIAGASLGFGEGGLQRTTDDIGKLQKTFQGAEGSNIITAFKAYLAQQAASTQNLFSRLSGGIVNPNLELLFENPDLRTFTYNFQLSPRNPPEAREIREIIRFFKQGMAVQRSPENLFLSTPNVFAIKYLLAEGKDEDHPYLNRIKKCALTNCSVDYTPTGSYMTFSGEENSMVSYNLSLIFKELEPIYADDYVKIDGGEPNAPITSIGY
jgi:hypothetical protein